MEYGLIGEKLGHSFSKEIHEILGNPSYELREIPREELGAFMRQKDFRGINVTIPYKQEVIPYLDECSIEAKAIGAVNTIVNENGFLKGYNTDAKGFQLLVESIHLSCPGKTAAILGTGGTSHTAEYVLKSMGISLVYKVSRTAKEGAITYDEIPSNIDLIVNTTPCGMSPNNEDTPLNLDRFPSLSGVIDVVYNPLKTRLIQQAEARKIPAIGGLRMLVGQAIEASKLFLNRDYPSSLLLSLERRVARKRQNIVLIGMPGCGKSTVGKALAEQMHRPFFDSDSVIEEENRISIASFIPKHGEPAFRKLEEQAIQKLSLLTGAVIATGGGVILNPKNMERLSQNGVIVFLDRELSRLAFSSSRPLSSDRESLRKRFEERYSLYHKYADAIVPSTAIRATVEKIKGALE